MGIKEVTEVLANTATSGSQKNAVLAELASGNIVAVWEGEMGIHAQIFLANGTKSGSEFVVNNYTTGSQYDPHVAATTDGFAISWTGEGSGAVDGIHAKAYGSDNLSIGPQVVVHAFEGPIALNDIGKSRVMAESSGGFSVVFSDYPNGGSDLEIYRQEYTALGAASGSLVTVSSGSIFGDQYPDGTLLTGGERAIAWASGVNVLVNIDGTEYTVSTDSSLQKRIATICPLTNGNFVVAWVERVASGGYNVDFQVMSSSGSKIGSETNAAFVFTSVNTRPALTQLPDAKFMLLWGDNAASATIYENKAQIFDATDQSKVGPELTIASSTIANAPSATRGQHLSMSTLADGSIAMVFEDTDLDTSGGIDLKIVYPLIATNTNQALAYTEDTVANLSDIVITAVNNSTVTAQLTLSDTGAGSFNTATSGSVTSTYTPGTGVWEASGATDDVNTLLAGLQFTPTEDYNSAFTVAVSINDGSSYTLTDSIAATGTPTYDAPKLSSTSSGALDFDEDDPATAIDPLITLVVENPTVASATVTISSNYVQGEDVLLYPVTLHGVTGVFTPGTGELSLTGTATPSQYQEILRSIQYSNSDQDPNTNVRTISFQVNDGISAGNVYDRNISVTPINDKPVLGGSGAALPYIEQGTAITVASGLTVSDVDSTQIQGATVSVIGFEANKDSLTFTDTTNVSGSYNPTTGVLTVTGTADLSEYQTFLRSVKYENQDDNATPGARTIRFVVQDTGGADSDPLDQSINLSVVNDKPVLGGSGAALPYQEQGTAITVASGLTVSDVDNTQIQGATVSVIGFEANKDSLTFTDTTNVSGSYNPTTGVLTVTGTADLSEYQTFLRSVKYENQDDNATPGARTIQFVVQDTGGADSDPLDQSINLSVVNDKPVLGGSGAALPYQEQGTAITVASGLTVSDVDNTQIQGATVSVIGFEANKDSLTFTDTANVSGSYNPTTGVLTVTGTADLSEYQTFLRSVKYENQDDNATPGVRTIRFVVQDTGGADSDPLEQSINLSVVNDKPVLAGSGSALPYQEQGTAITVASGLTVSDVDSTQIQGATVSVIGFEANKDSLTFTDTANVSGSYNPTTGVLTVTGTADLSEYQTFLRSVKYENQDDNATPGARTIRFVVQDTGGADSDPLDQSINLSVVNDKPVLAGSGSALPYQEQGTAITVASGLTVSDVDSTQIQGATVSVIGFEANKDSLTFTDTANVSGSYNPTTGVLTVTGTADLSEYQTFLRSVKYENQDDNATPGVRTIRFVVQDTGGADSDPLDQSINLSVVNDKPVLSGGGAALPYQEGGSAITVDNAISISDSDNTQLQGATVSVIGFEANKDSLTFTDITNVSGSYNPTTGVLTVSGNADLSEYETFLRSVKYENQDNNPTAGTRTIRFVVQDTGGADSDPLDRNITLSVVNDKPELQTSSGNVAYEVGADPVDIDVTIQASDADSTQLQSATVSVIGFEANKDTLLFTNTANLTGNYDADTGILSVSGAASVAEYTSFLQSVQYQNWDNSPTLGSRTIRFVVNDGEFDSIALDKTLTLSASVNARPTIISLVSPAVEYEEQAAPVTVNANLGVSDIDSANLQSAIVRIIGFEANKDRLTFTNTANISGSFDSATGVLSATGAAAPSEYQTFLRSVQYDNPDDNPMSGNRTVVFTVNDGGLNSAPFEQVVTVSLVNDPAVLATTSSGGLSYQEGADPITVDSLLTVQDDSPQLQSATVSIEGFEANKDTLLFTNTANISGSFDPATGILSATGAALPSEYQTFLRSVQYQNTDPNPAEGVRTVNFVVNDGEFDSAPLGRNVTVTPVNTPPVIVINQLNIGKGETVDLTAAEISVTDDSTPADQLELIIQDVTHGSFADLGTPGTHPDSFLQAQIGQGVQFVHDNSDTAPSYRLMACEPGPSGLCSGPEDALVTFKEGPSNSGSDQTGRNVAIGVGTTVGVLALGGAMVTGYMLWRRKQQRAQDTVERARDLEADGKKGSVELNDLKP